MTPHEKQRKWQSVLAQVAGITDRLGMPVDKEIVETVAILQLFGFMTTSSCEGHADRITEGPFVILRSSAAFACEKQLMDIANRDSQEFADLKNKLTCLSIAEQRKLSTLLKDFYASRKQYSAGEMLTLRMIGRSDFRLNCQGSELAYAEDAHARAERLARNRMEMKAFTEWLKEAYGFVIAYSDQKDVSVEMTQIAESSPGELVMLMNTLANVISKYINIRIEFVHDSLFDGANAGPYALFTSAKAEEIRQTLAAKKDLTVQARNALFREALEYNVADQRPLYRLLIDFYAQHTTAYEHMLIVQTVGFSNFRLRFQGADSLLLEDEKNQQDLFEIYSTEIKALIGYLKEREPKN